MSSTIQNQTIFEFVYINDKVYVRDGRITAEFRLFCTQLIADIMVREIVNMRTINTKFVYMWVFFYGTRTRRGGGGWGTKYSSFLI